MACVRMAAWQRAAATAAPQAMLLFHSRSYKRANVHLNVRCDCLVATAGCRCGSMLVRVQSGARGAAGRGGYRYRNELARRWHTVMRTPRVATMHAILTIKPATYTADVPFELFRCVLAHHPSSGALHFCWRCFGCLCSPRLRVAHQPHHNGGGGGDCHPGSATTACTTCSPRRACRAAAVGSKGSRSGSSSGSARGCASAAVQRPHSSGVRQGRGNGGSCSAASSVRRGFAGSYARSPAGCGRRIVANDGW